MRASSGFSEIPASLPPEKVDAVAKIGRMANMEAIMEIAERHGIFVVEDAAQAMMSSYKGKSLGTIGHIGAYSFHETKNYTSAGEGGLLIINDENFIKRAEIIREKGTNRSQFFRGAVDKYSWVDIGSSYLMNDVSAAYLWGNLEKSDEINKFRTKIWNKYYSELEELANKGLITLPTVPKHCIHNAHMFYLKVKNIKVRTDLLKFLKSNNILSVFHYIPLHSSKAGENFGKFIGQDLNTTAESERLIRLPIYYGLDNKKVNYIINTIKRSYNEARSIS